MLSHCVSDVLGHLCACYRINEIHVQLYVVVVRVQKHDTCKPGDEVLSLMACTVVGLNS